MNSNSSDNVEIQAVDNKPVEVINVNEDDRSKGQFGETTGNFDQQESNLIFEGQNLTLQQNIEVKLVDIPGRDQSELKNDFRLDQSKQSGLLEFQQFPLQFKQSRELGQESKVSDPPNFYDKIIEQYKWNEKYGMFSSNDTEIPIKSYALAETNIPEPSKNASQQYSKISFLQNKHKYNTCSYQPPKSNRFQQSKPTVGILQEPQSNQRDDKTWTCMIQ